MKPRKKPWPKLSETLTGPRDPDHCQSCGEWGDAQPWCECDEKDTPTETHLMLCSECAEKIIEKHPRLYLDRHRNAPIPGAMQLCVDCIHRDALRCACPDAHRNGGCGIKIEHAEPSVIFMDGTKGGRRCGWTEMRYGCPPKSCSGRETSGVLSLPIREDIES